MGRLRIAITTLGCKVNRADGDALRTELAEVACEAAREVPFEEEADLYVVNTCTVTATADRRSRQLVYQARRRNPKARVVLTGCFAHVDPAAAARIPGVDRVFLLAEHAALVDYIGEVARAAAGRAPDGTAIVAHRGARDRARPLLKIQDGCDARCAYCIVPAARGPSRSVPAVVVLAALAGLARQGCEEVVLSGIHLGRYGRDLAPPTSLPALLCAAVAADGAAESGGPRLRLSSVEPAEVSEELIALFETTPRLCPHLHLPIQSADDGVLTAMGRGATPAAAIDELLRALRRRLPGAALGADLIAGFPGESEAQAARTLRFAQTSPLSHLHVFPFSPRPLTPAAERAEQLPPATVRGRALALRAVARRKLAAFAAAQVGTTQRVLIERLAPAASGGLTATGVTGSYLRATVPLPAAAVTAVARGRLIAVHVVGATGGALRARYVPENCTAPKRSEGHIAEE